jgi:hypothetical protein
MGESRVDQLTAAVCGTLVAVARSEEVVQVWDSATGEKVSEFKAPYAFGGYRLAMNPTGSLCAVGSFYKGRRGGIACYDVQSAKTLWHRTDIRHTQLIRFASDSKSVYCGREMGPLLRLCGASGETLEELHDTMDVQESPYSAHALVVPRSSAYILQGARRFCFERRTYLSPCMHKRTGKPTAIAFGPDAVWLADQGLENLLRCFDYTGIERWQVAIPQSTIIWQLCYRVADGHFYGVEQEDKYSSGHCRLVRYADSGAGEKVATISPGWGDRGFCLSGDRVVTAAGDVVETTRGTIIDNIRFN